MFKLVCINRSIAVETNILCGTKSKKMLKKLPKFAHEKLTKFSGTKNSPKKVSLISTHTWNFSTSVRRIMHRRCRISWIHCSANYCSCCAHPRSPRCACASRHFLSVEPCRPPFSTTRENVRVSLE